ncbi:DUF58 domain-containing protein [Halobacillus halophilus]|uniref:DUF58 domain-containing protein n=1 Tax=Halobacillus halophilus TaxID=1570 RepID=UPI001CD29590|nr:DUF58 domain-containing protein [Halobacillus halophilus]MCA1011130.1 DUF58 domain-containing protein [Halobacillus halophilus]
MNQWKKDLGYGNHKYYDFLLAMILLTGVLSLFLNQSNLLIPTSLLVVIALASKWYDGYSGASLKLFNHRTSIRLFPGEDTSLHFRFRNNSKAPVLNGRLSFESNSNIKADSSITRKSSKGHQYSLPLSLMSEGEKEVRLPIKAVKRGVTKITDIQYRFPHLIKFTSISMKFLPHYETEIVIYPNQMTVYGMEEVFQIAPGQKRASFSPFEDLLTPVGTRDYVSSDPFHRIHWKASAKTGTLQTKVYEREADISWTIVVNVTQQTRLGNEHISGNLENLLSYASYLCYFAARNNYDFELLVNMRRPHEKPFFFQPEGSGNQQLKDSLELLARIQVSQLFMPVEELMHRLHHNLYKKKTIIFVGDIPEHTYRYIKEWNRKGLKVFQVQVEEGQAILVPFSYRGASV